MEESRDQGQAVRGREREGGGEREVEEWIERPWRVDTAPPHLTPSLTYSHSAVDGREMMICSSM